MHPAQIGISIGQVIIIVVSAIWTARHHFERLSDYLKAIEKQNSDLENDIKRIDARIGAQDDRIEGLYLAMQIFVSAPISPSRGNRGADKEMTGIKARGEEDGG